MKLSGWGRFPVRECCVRAPRDEAELFAYLCDGRAIARGNGRAYGDSALGTANTLHMRHFNRMLAFDAARGQLVVEAGVLLSDVIATFLPRGWFPAVTPGTKFVTIGGMTAADVHGKNHHREGSFGAVVDWFDLIDADGALRRCSRSENEDLFAWTIGGMGLTGVILRTAIRLRPVRSAWIAQQMIPAANLDAAMDAFEAAQDATYSVAWIDCLSTGGALGRSLVMLGEHAEPEELPAQLRGAPLRAPAKRSLAVPFDFPGGVLNRFSVRAFNALYYWNGARKTGKSIVDWDSYFYPLDAILGWNRIYGRHGFVQYQCALPLAQSREGLRALLVAISRAGAGSFLAVLKRFGPQNSRFSFPMEGYTLALDFPVTARNLRLMDALDEITLAHGGRFYLAKDSRLSAATFHKADARAAEFARMRDETGARPSFSSTQAERLEL
jgi:FAD/FMN-containing dehydrogenase